MRLYLDPKKIEKLADELRVMGMFESRRPMVLGPPAKHFCRICGAEREGPEQIDTISLASTFSTKLDGAYRTPCPTPKCGRVCKICRRDIGDVHGPDCGSLMVTKLERPHIVDRSDCV